jgi:hypothetical protein
MGRFGLSQQGEFNVRNVKVCNFDLETMKRNTGTAGRR